jgi:hypothetical protein
LRYNDYNLISYLENRGKCIKNNNLNELLEIDEVIENLPRVDLTKELDVSITFSRLHANKFNVENLDKF